MGIGNGDAPALIGPGHYGTAVPRINGSNGGNSRGNGGGKHAKQAAAPKAPLSNPPSGEGTHVTRRHWSDDEVDTAVIMLTRSGSRRYAPYPNGCLKGAKRRKMLRPLRSPSL